MSVRANRREFIRATAGLVGASLDFARMMRIVLDSGYVGIDYEGTRLGEPDGVRATVALLTRLQAPQPLAR